MISKECPICESKCRITTEYGEFWGGRIKVEINYDCNNCGGIHWAYGNYSDYFKPRLWQFKRKRNLTKLIGGKPIYVWNKRFKRKWKNGRKD